jgi:hypothetical protein
MAKPVICSACGTVAKPKSYMQGSLIVEIFAWCLMLFPGFLYSLWRLTTKRKGCRACGSNEIAPLNTPRGRALLAQYPQVPR